LLTNLLPFCVVLTCSWPMEFYVWFKFLIKSSSAYRWKETALRLISYFNLLTSYFLSFELLWNKRSCLISSRSWFIVNFGCIGGSKLLFCCTKCSNICLPIFWSKWLCSWSISLWSRITITTKQQIFSIRVKTCSIRSFCLISCINKRLIICIVSAWSN
jgi:hypothetical protein